MRSKHRACFFTFSCCEIYFCCAFVLHSPAFYYVVFWNEVLMHSAFGLDDLAQTDAALINFVHLLQLSLQVPRASTQAGQREGTRMNWDWT